MTALNDPRWIVRATLIERGFHMHRPPGTFRGPLPVHGTPVDVEIEVADPTFIRMPEVRLLSRRGLPRRIAHVNDDSTICYVGGGGLPLDMYDPGGSVLRVLLEAQAALEESFGGRANAELERELASYWESSGSLIFAIDPGTENEIIRAHVVIQGRPSQERCVVIREKQWPEIRTRLPATVIVLKNNLQPAEGFRPSTLEEAQKFVAAQVELPPGWNNALIAAAKPAHYTFLAAPNAIVGWISTPRGVLAAATARPKQFRAGVLEKMVAKSPALVSLERKIARPTGLSFTVQRNLYGRASLIEKRVALVGCGTIGGYLARMLAQSGAGCNHEFLLYDTDTLASGNLGRHALGFNDLSRSKAEAVADYARSFHPDVKVVARPVDAAREWSTLERFDIIIDATGEPNVATRLNDLLLRSTLTKVPALLHAWVWGNGSAVQTFLNLRDGHSCYRCLRSGFSGDWRHNPLKETNGKLEQAPASCGAAGYVPFAVDAPAISASLAIRAALDWAGGRPGHRLRTLVLDDRVGRKGIDWVSPSPLNDCEACGGTGRSAKCVLS